MLVRCTENRIDELAASGEVLAELRNAFHLPEGRVHLTIGKVYVVYAIEVRALLPWYFIADDVHSWYPSVYAAPFFQVVDGRVSNVWHYRCMSSGQEAATNASSVVLLAPARWAKEYSYYERLVNADAAVSADFARVSAAMDLEFPHPAVAATAIVSQGNWLACPQCENVWEDDSRSAMLRCPVCSSILLNPRLAS